MNYEYLPSREHNIPPTAASDKLKLTEYFLVISSSGDVLKTKFEPEFVIVKTWGNVVFAAVVSNNKTLFYMIGDKEFSEKIKSLKTSDPFSKDCCFHFTELEHSGHQIKKCWIETTLPKRLSL